MGHNRFPGPKWFIGALIAGWVGLMGGAFFFLVRHEQTPGAATASVATNLPAELKLSFAPDRTVLLMFVHPRCPCSRASLGELEEMMSHAPGSSEVCMVFYKPAGEPDDWVKTGLYKEAQRVGWQTRVDPGGALAARFGATTSGHVLIYDAKGRLSFSGGITASRGHWGDSESEATALKVLQNELPGMSTRPVYGCPLQSPAASRVSIEQSAIVQTPHAN